MAEVSENTFSAKRIFEQVYSMIL